jgi:signal peptidase II
LFCLASLFLILDQLSKFFVQCVLEEHESFVVIDKVFKLTLVKNPGAAFGLLPGLKGLLLLGSLVIILVLLAFIRLVEVRSDLVFWGFSLALGGALGNLMDRLRLGAVVDFLDFSVWPVFNFADSFLVVGLSLLLIGFLKEVQQTRSS